MKKKMAVVLSIAASLAMVACAKTEPIEQAFKINDKLFYNTNQEIYELRIGTNDGEIYGSVEEGEVPQENNHSNFGYYYKYSEVDEHHYDVYNIEGNGLWLRFCDKECDEDHSEPIYPEEGVTAEGEVITHEGDIISNEDEIESPEEESTILTEEPEIVELPNQTNEGVEAEELATEAKEGEDEK